MKKVFLFIPLLLFSCTTEKDDKIKLLETELELANNRIKLLERQIETLRDSVGLHTIYFGEELGNDDVPR